MPTIEATKPKNQHLFQRFVVEADSSNNAPTRIEVVRAGQWPEDSNKGMLYITPIDLNEMKANFDAGIGCAGGLGKLPIDFSHMDHQKAAGWITKLTVEGDVLIADVSWSAAGLEAIQGEEFKFFSPSFYPGCLGEWQDPEDWNIRAKNVLVGGALTNIPFFKNLQPVTASNNSQEGDEKNILFVDADAKGATMPTLEEVRAKDFSALTEDEKTLLTEHQSELTADEKVKFGFETAPAVTADNKVEGETITEAQKKILASVESGEMKLVKAADHDALQASVTKLEASVAASTEKEVRAEVLTHVQRGAIKADQVDVWTAKIMADESAKELLAGLNDNPTMAAEAGKTGGSVAGSAAAMIDEKAKAIVKASTENGGKAVEYSVAVDQALKANPELAQQYQSERAGKES